MQVGLVACGSKKLSKPAEAQYLYQGALFRYASAYAQATCDRWVILSALHGVVAPDQVLAPYDATLNTMGRDERVAWAKRCLDALSPLRKPAVQFVMLAGKNYADPLAGWLDAERPLQGLGIGKQLAWYRAQGISLGGKRDL